MLEEHRAQSVAKEVCEKISGHVIEQLKDNTKDMQSGDGTLSSFWDEICVQVQGGPFFFWESYLDEARELIWGEVAKVNERDSRAFWLLFQEWLDACGGEGVASYKAVAVDYILNHYVLAEAKKWDSPRISAFLAKERAR